MTPELQKLIDELDSPHLTEARWRELCAQAEPIIDEIETFEFFEPFLIAGNRRGWTLPDA